MKYLSAFLLTVAVVSSAVAQQNLDTFRREHQPQEVRCTVTTEQENAVYGWFQTHLHDFKSLKVLGWGKVWKDRSASSVTVVYTSCNRMGYVSTKSAHFTFRNGQVVSVVDGS